MESRLANVIKFMINAILIIIQLFVFIIVISEISDFTYQIYWIIELSAILVVLDIIYQRKEASAKISWIIFVLIIPILGIVLYLIWGRLRISKKSKLLWAEGYEDTYLALEQDPLLYQSLKIPD